MFVFLPLFRGDSDWGVPAEAAAAARPHGDAECPPGGAESEVDPRPQWGSEQSWRHTVWSTAWLERAAGTRVILADWTVSEWPSGNPNQTIHWGRVFRLRSWDETENPFLHWFIHSFIHQIKYFFIPTILYLFFRFYLKIYSNVIYWVVYWTNVYSKYVIYYYYLLVSVIRLYIYHLNMSLESEFLNRSSTGGWQPPGGQRPCCR